MSPEFQLNSRFHSVPVKGDYKLSKKNEILVDLFLNTLFHAVPPSTTHNLPSLQSGPFFQQSLPLPFIFIPGPQPTGSLGVEVRSEATWLVHVAEREQPGNKGLHCWGICCPVPNFHLRPPPL